MVDRLTRLIAALCVAALGCGCARPQSAAPSEPVRIDPPAHPTAPAQRLPGKVTLIPAPDYPDAAVVIADQLVQSETAHHRLLVYEGATWCDPCRRFHAAAERGELDRDLPDLDLMVFDADKDSARLRAAGYTSKYIPLFVVPGPDGRASGKQTEGGLEGERAVAQLIPRLVALVNQP